MDFLAETALLTRGLASIKPEALATAWPFDTPVLVWVEQGKIIRGTLQDYLPFRAKAADLPRLDCDILPQVLKTGGSGSLTASGTMAVCEMLQIPLAVTCGMGGIGQIHAEQLCADLPALARYPVALIASSPKDMLDIPATLQWLTDHGVHIAGPDCSGWVFRRSPIPLPESPADYPDQQAIVHAARNGGLLLLNPIAEDRRITDHSILDRAIAAGKRAEAAGGDYHPAANAEIHRLTGGYSACLQLEAFVDNLRLASSL